MKSEEDAQNQHQDGSLCGKTEQRTAKKSFGESDVCE